MRQDGWVKWMTQCSDYRYDLSLYLLVKVYHVLS
jgi:hypothetical protein